MRVKRSAEDSFEPLIHTNGALIRKSDDEAFPFETGKCAVVDEIADTFAGSLHLVSISDD
jgi:hypothetical protein